MNASKLSSVFRVQTNDKICPGISCTLPPRTHFLGLSCTQDGNNKGTGMYISIHLHLLSAVTFDRFIPTHDS